MVIEKQLLDIKLELKAISERIEKSLAAFDDFEKSETIIRAAAEGEMAKKEN